MKGLERKEKTPILLATGWGVSGIIVAEQRIFFMCNNRRAPSQHPSREQTAALINIYGSFESAMRAWREHGAAALQTNSRPHGGVGATKPAGKTPT
jgi:hypothetical protein